MQKWQEKGAGQGDNQQAKGKKWGGKGSNSNTCVVAECVKDMAEKVSIVQKSSRSRAKSNRSWVDAATEAAAEQLNTPWGLSMTG